MPKEFLNYYLALLSAAAPALLQGRVSVGRLQYDTIIITKMHILCQKSSFYLALSSAAAPAAAPAPAGALLLGGVSVGRLQSDMIKLIKCIYYARRVLFTLLFPLPLLLLRLLLLRELFFWEECRWGVCKVT